MSYAWGYIFDGLKLDLGDYIGAAVALAGIVYYCICDVLICSMLNLCFVFDNYIL